MGVYQNYLPNLQVVLTPREWGKNGAPEDKVTKTLRYWKTPSGIGLPAGKLTQSFWPDCQAMRFDAILGARWYNKGNRPQPLKPWGPYPPASHVGDRWWPWRINVKHQRQTRQGPVCRTIDWQPFGETFDNVLEGGFVDWLYHRASNYQSGSWRLQLDKDQIKTSAFGPTWTADNISLSLRRTVAHLQFFLAVVRANAQLGLQLPITNFKFVWGAGRNKPEAQWQMSTNAPAEGYVTEKGAYEGFRNAIIQKPSHTGGNWVVLVGVSLAFARRPAGSTYKSPDHHALICESIDSPPRKPTDAWLCRISNPWANQEQLCWKDGKVIEEWLKDAGGKYKFLKPQIVEVGDLFKRAPSSFSNLIARNSRKRSDWNVFDVGSLITYGTNITALLQSLPSGTLTEELFDGLLPFVSSVIIAEVF